MAAQEVDEQTVITITLAIAVIANTASSIAAASKP